jgi:hypothetical protein
MKDLDVRDETIWSLLRHPAMAGPGRAWPLVAGLALVGWIGAVAFVGRYRSNQVSGALYALAPPNAWFVRTLIVATAAVLGLVIARRSEICGLCKPNRNLWGLVHYAAAYTESARPRRAGTGPARP